MTLAIKKIFPNFYKLTKKISNSIPMRVTLREKQILYANYGIYKMINQWRGGSLKEEADIAYKYYEGGDFIDIGSFNSFYSFLLSPKGKSKDRFISCEPDPKAYPVAKENLKILKKNFKTLEYHLITSPIGSGEHVVIAHNDWGHPCFLNDKSSELNEEKKKTRFKSISIDHLVQKMILKPTFIKIDTEGSELDILINMKKTISIYKPKILLEKHPTLIPKNSSLQMIDDFLRQNKYLPTLINKSDLAIREIWK